MYLMYLKKWAHQLMREIVNLNSEHFSRYGDTLYFLIITASTVGYGDFFPVTDLGKLFMSLYLTGNLALTLCISLVI
jgi:hypothetical protein